MSSLCVSSTFYPLTLAPKPAVSSSKLLLPVPIRNSRSSNHRVVDVGRVNVLAHLIMAGSAWITVALVSHCASNAFFLSARHTAVVVARHPAECRLHICKLCALCREPRLVRLRLWRCACDEVGGCGKRRWVLAFSDHPRLSINWYSSM